MAKLKIVYKKITDLKPAEYNPRKIGTRERMELTKSLKNFDMVVPIVVNINPKRKNVIIGGHQRVMVAKDLGYKEMPCVEVDLSLDKEKELNLRLNKNGGEFDPDLLSLLDKDLLRQVGFLDKEINKAFADSGTIAQEEEFTSEVLEENNYIVFIFNNSIDWLTISDKLDLKSVNALDSKEDYRRKGIGRVVDGKKLLELLQ
jgi:ParB-like chromosome segregation protein Spo0J